MSLPSPWRRGFTGILALDGEGQTSLESAATAQKQQAMLDLLFGHYAGGAAHVQCAQNLPGERTTCAVENNRDTLIRWLNVSGPFTRSSTAALNLPAYDLGLRR